MKTFHYLQVFTFTDLSIQFTVENSYTSPFSVSYTLFEVSGNGARIQRTSTRLAVKDNTGVYHVVGRAGEGGQPGQWLVQWEWQMAFDGPVEYREEEYTVLDCASDPNDHLARTRKYGWI